MTSNNLCNSCTNIGCEFQSGIVRTKCAFYMPPHIEPDNCGNYVVMQPTHETRLKNDMVTILDKIRDEIADLADSDAYGDYQQGFNFGLMRAAQIIDKHRESEG